MVDELTVNGDNITVGFSLLGNDYGSYAILVDPTGQPIELQDGKIAVVATITNPFVLPTGDSALLLNKTIADYLKTLGSTKGLQIAILDEQGNQITDFGGDTSTLATQATLNEIKTLFEESGIAISIEDRVYSPNTALMSAVVVNSATPVLSTVWPCAIYAQKSLRIQAVKTGTWDNGVTVEVQGAEDDVEANYAPIYEIGTDGVITLSDAINRIYSIPYHVNYIRLKVTNNNTTPASNYPTMTVKAMGQV